ncbi:hypothetical protein V8E36_009754 [Tilletia maclaganii]
MDDAIKYGEAAVFFAGHNRIAKMPDHDRSADIGVSGRTKRAKLAVVEAVELLPWIFFKVYKDNADQAEAYGLLYAEVKGDGTLKDAWIRKISKEAFDKKNKDALPRCPAFGSASQTNDKLAVYVIRDADLSESSASLMTRTAHSRHLIFRGARVDKYTMVHLQHPVAMMGIRAFDLRLKADGSSKFVPFHGIASPVGDQLAGDSSTVGKDEYLVAQLRAFMDKNPGEILFIRITTKGGNEDALWRTWFNLLGDYLIPTELSRYSYKDIKRSQSKALPSAQRSEVRCHDAGRKSGDDQTKGS